MAPSAEHAHTRSLKVHSQLYLKTGLISCHNLFVKCIKIWVFHQGSAHMQLHLMVTHSEPVSLLQMCVVALLGFVLYLITYLPDERTSMQFITKVRDTWLP